MARLTAAAGLAWATLLMCVVLSAAQTRGDLLATLFPTGSLPPPVKIYCKMNPVLNMAVRNGRVVLVPDDCSDLSQKWYTVQSPASSLTGPFPFSLLNAQSFQIITIPSGVGQPLGLSSPTDSARAALEQLWLPETKSTTSNDFYQVFVYNNRGLTLNGLGGAQDGTLVGVFPPSPDFGNAVWKITSSPPCVR